MACTEDPNPPDFGTPEELLQELTDADVAPVAPWQRREDRAIEREVERASSPAGW